MLRILKNTNFIDLRMKRQNIRMDGWKDRWKDGWMDEWKNGWMDGWIKA